jgi:hypothetical protein
MWETTTYHSERPAIVADYQGLVVLKHRYLEGETDEGEEDLRYVKAQLQARDVLRIPLELVPAHLDGAIAGMVIGKLFKSELGK